MPDDAKRDEWEHESRNQAEEHRLFDVFQARRAELGENAVLVRCQIEVEVVTDERLRTGEPDFMPEAEVMDWIDDRILVMAADPRFPMRIGRVSKRTR